MKPANSTFGLIQSIINMYNSTNGIIQMLSLQFNSNDNTVLVHITTDIIQPMINLLIEQMSSYSR